MSINDQAVQIRQWCWPLLTVFSITALLMIFTKDIMPYLNLQTGIIIVGICVITMLNMMRSK